jgi:hypothetical protein
MKQLIFFLFFLPMITSAQEFSFELYFEDALGNRDTLVLGYDPLATDSIDVAFGEENVIAQPWDSVLDVRIGNKTYSENTWLTENTYLSKKQIISSFCENSIISSRISIQFYAKNYPIKFKWDKTQFENDTCRFFSVFFGKQDALNIDAISGTFLQYSDSLFFQPYTSNLGQTSLFAHQISLVNGQLTIHYPINTFNTLNKEIGVCQFVFYSYRTASLDDKSIVETKISPNPVNSNENITINAQGNYTIVDIQGKAIQKGIIENNSVQLINVESGIYFFILENENAVYKTKFVVR